MKAQGRSVVRRPRSGVYSEPIRRSIMSAKRGPSGAVPRSSRALPGLGALAAIVLAAAFASPARAANITITIDRKFPVGRFCPLESRAAAGANLSFVATATSMPLTFSASNFHGGNFNPLHLDNISVQLKSVFDAHLLVTPGLDDDGAGSRDCYNPSTPPGQTSGGM